MNPAELPDWDVLKSKELLEAYLAETFLGVSPEASPTAPETVPGSGESAPEASPENASEENQDAGEETRPEKISTSQLGESFVEPRNVSESEHPVVNSEHSEAASAVKPDSEVKEEDSIGGESVPADREPDAIIGRKSISDMSYWELMANANDSNVVHAAKRSDESAGEISKDISAPEGESEGAQQQAASAPESSGNLSDGNLETSDSFIIDGIGQINSLGGFDFLYGLQTKEIQKKLEDWGVEYRRGVGKSELISDYYRYAAKNKKLVKINGVLDVFEDGFGGAVAFEADNYKLRRMSVYVPQMFIEKYALKRGHKICALAMPPRDGGKETCPIAVKILSVMGSAPDDARNVVAFTDLIPYYPTRRIIMEATGAGWDNLSMRAVDLLTPIGFGQRALIVAPPRTGKTVLMQGMAKSIRLNAPDAHLMILLVDERPEEVTDFRRSVDAEVIASTFDEDALSHVHAAEMVISKARRMVETGKDVVILLDSITRLARAYNALMPNGGRTMSGGVEANALQKPKKFFGSARNIEGGGSLTIIATALIETGSKMDEVIFEEFKGTGNLELHLDRALSDKRIFPAINIEKSGTRKEELLYHPDELTKIYALRRAMKGIPPADAMEMLVQRLKKVKTNVEFLIGLNR